MTSSVFQLAFYYYRLLHPTVQVTARLPLAQAVHESANFTSNVFETNNNALGMMAPKSRETTCLNRGGKGFAVYGSVLDGIADYILWLEALGLTDDAKLDAHIKAGKYATDKAYYTKIQRVVTELKAADKYIAPGAIYAGAGVAGVAAALGLVAGISSAIKS